MGEAIWKTNTWKYEANLSTCPAEAKLGGAGFPTNTTKTFDNICQRRGDFPSLLPVNPVRLVRGSLDPAAKGCADDLKSWESDREHRGQPAGDPVLLTAEECAGFH